MLDKNKAIRIEKYFHYSFTTKDPEKGYRNIYIFICNLCTNEIKSREEALKKHSELCQSCARKIAIKKYGSREIRPFEAVYNVFNYAAKVAKRKVEISYEEFLEFTKVDKCHYCYTKILWYPHTKHNIKELPGARNYRLDRKDNSLHYTKDNCVVCCSRCNHGKGAKFTYEEWCGMTRYFRDKVEYE